MPLHMWIWEGLSNSEDAETHCFEIGSHCVAQAGLGLAALPLPPVLGYKVCPTQGLKCSSLF